jgi:hypothetical protein
MRFRLDGGLDDVPLAPTHDPGYQRVIGRRMNWRLSLLCSQ